MYPNEGKICIRLLNLDFLGIGIASGEKWIYHGFTISFLQNDVQQGENLSILFCLWPHISSPISGEKIWKPIVDRQTHCCQKHSKTHIAIHTALSIPKEGLWGFIPFIPWFHMIPGCRTHENSGPESSPHLCCWPENWSPEPCSKCLTSWQQIRKCLRHRLRFAMFCLCAYLVLCGAYVGFCSPEFCLLPQPSKGPLPKHEHKGLERGSPVITSARRHPEVWDAYWDAYVHLWGHLQETGMIVRKDCGTHFPVATQSFIHNESQYIIYMYIYMCVCVCVLHLFLINFCWCMCFWWSKPYQHYALLHEVRLSRGHDARQMAIGHRHHGHNYNVLVAGWPTPLKQYDESSVGMMKFPTEWKNK